MYTTLKKYLNNENLMEVIRFGLVGMMNTLVDFAVFLLLTSFTGIGILVCQIISYNIGVTNSFVMNRLWTFKSDGNTKESVVREGVQFVIINLLSLGSTLLLIKILMNISSLNTIVIKLMVMVIGQFVNYFGYKFWVFK